MGQSGKVWEYGKSLNCRSCKTHRCIQKQIHRDKGDGTISTTKDSTGKYVIDTAELARAYGEFEYPPQSDNGNGGNSQRDKTGQNGNGVNANSAVISVLEEQVTLLKTQLERAESKLESAAEREGKLLELTDRLQKQNEMLMLPPPQKEHTPFWKRLFQST